MYTVLGKVANVIIYTFVIYGVVQKLYPISFKNGVIESKIAFTKSQFDNYIGEVLSLTLYIAAVSFIITLLYCIVKIVSQHQGSKLFAIVSAAIIGFFGFAIFVAGYVSKFYKTMKEEMLFGRFCRYHWARYTKNLIPLSMLSLQ